MALADCAAFLGARFETMPVTVLLFSDDAFELPLPLVALRVLRLRAIGTSAKVPTIGVAVLEVRPARVVTGAGAGISISIPTGS